jgi:hypothetical protein
VPALCSVAAIERWLTEEPAARGWDCLIALERECGGLIFGPSWGLAAPDRIGPYLMLADRTSLEPLGLNAADEDFGDGQVPPEDCVQHPWPFLCRRRVELAVVGYQRENLNSALCADRAGTLYFADNEFGSLTPLAATMTGLLEKRALRWEVHDEGRGFGAEPALAMAVDAGEALAADLGFAPVAEACDRVSAWFVADGAALLLQRAVTAQEPQTTLYTRDPERAVAVARALRAADREATLYVRISTADPAADARRRALEGAGVEPLEARGWYGWGSWSHS